MHTWYPPSGRSQHLAHRQLGHGSRLCEAEAKGR
jgi:hypothetical protein